MNNKYADLERDFLKTVSELADITGWPEEQAGKVLELVIRASEKKADTVARHNRAAQKDAAVIATEKLLKNYRKLKWSIQCGTEHTMKLLEDGEYHRFAPESKRFTGAALSTQAADEKPL